MKFNINITYFCITVECQRTFLQTQYNINMAEVSFSKFIFKLYITTTPQETSEFVCPFQDSLQSPYFQNMAAHDFWKNQAPLKVSQIGHLEIEAPKDSSHL